MPSKFRLWVFEGPPQAPEDTDTKKRPRQATAEQNAHGIKKMPRQVTAAPIAHKFEPEAAADRRKTVSEGSTWFEITKRTQCARD